MYVQIPTLESESVRTRTYVHVINTNYHPPNPRFGSKIQSLGGRKGVLGGSGPPKPPIRVSRPPKPGFGGPGGGSKPRFGPPKPPIRGFRGPPARFPDFRGVWDLQVTPYAQGLKNLTFTTLGGGPSQGVPRTPQKRGFLRAKPRFYLQNRPFLAQNPDSGVWGGSGPPNQPRGLVYKNSI